MNKMHLHWLYIRVTQWLSHTHAKMKHTSSAEVPKGIIKVACSPAFSRSTKLESKLINFFALLNF